MLQPHEGEWICVEKRRAQGAGRANTVRRRGRMSDRGSILVIVEAVLGSIWEERFEMFIMVEKGGCQD